MSDNLRQISTKMIEVSGNVKYNSEEIEYGLKIFLNTLGVIFLTFFMTLFVNSFTEVLIVMLGFALLRQFSGGIHIHSSGLCILVSSFLVHGIVLVKHNFTFNDWSLTTLNLLTGLLLLIFAPLNAQIYLKTRINPRTLYKLISLTLVFINMVVINSELLTLTFFIQALTTIGRERRSE